MNDKPQENPIDPLAPMEIPDGHLGPEEILIARRGPGANCSSIGSALDLLFLSATLASVVMVGIAAAFSDERPRETPDEPKKAARKNDEVGEG